MKKILCLIILAVCFFSDVSANTQKEVVIFSQPCHFCEALKQDLNGGLIEKYPDIKFTVLDIQDGKNRRLLNKYAQKYDLHGDIGLPLIFVGKNYLMGWSEENKVKLEEDIEVFRQEEISRLPSSLL